VTRTDPKESIQFIEGLWDSLVTRASRLKSAAPAT
jgi:hypothetical protein